MVNHTRSLFRNETTFTVFFSSRQLKLFAFSVNKSCALLFTNIDCRLHEGWIATPSHHCIRSNQSMKATWDKAREVCKNINADLVLLEPEDEIFIGNVRYLIVHEIELDQKDSFKS